MNGRFAGVVAVVAAALAAQDPSPEAVRTAEALLRAQAEHSRGVRVLVADYVQRRTTRLAKESLVSRGSFVFVAQPGCLVFRAKEPRESVIRLSAETYEVYRPQKKQLERFVLDGPELARGLFAALAGDADVLLREFEVRSCAPDPARKDHSLVVLVPRAAAMRARLAELRLCLHGKDGALATVAYRDASGDLVEIELLQPVANPEKAPAVTFDLAPGTTVVEHRVPKKE